MRTTLYGPKNKQNNKEETHQLTIHGPLISKKTRGQWNTCWWCWWQPEIQKGQKTLVPNGAKAPWSLNGTSTTNLPQLVSLWTNQPAWLPPPPSASNLDSQKIDGRQKIPESEKKTPSFRTGVCLGGVGGGSKRHVLLGGFFGKFRTVKWWVMKHGIFCTVAFLIHGVIDVIHGQYLDM